MIHRLADEQKTIDLIIFGDANEAQLWAKKRPVTHP